MRTPQPWTGWDADRAVTALYLTHYRPLVRLAALLVPDPATAEEIVQDSFVAVHSAWPRRPDADYALSALRRSVVGRSRAALRGQAVVDRLAPERAPDTPGAPGKGPARSAFVSALWALPARQREVVVLRYFADLPGAKIASATGISRKAVGGQAARAMSSLRSQLRSRTRGAETTETRPRGA
jgi:RNA polymerase sigma factor (sigma-70 family)